MMDFYLGTHIPNWMQKTRVPLFLSYIRLRKGLRYRYRKPFKPSLGTTAGDSGGFSALNTTGRYEWHYKEYADDMRLFAEETRHLDWAACMDWMCEPIVRDKTGKSIQEHQELTIQNYLDLTAYAPDIRWTPVLQGWQLRDYWLHKEMYESAGVVLESLPLVGVGSICRRQGTREAAAIIKSLANAGISIHGFGLKMAGLSMVGDYLTSADSLAWSFGARQAYFNGLKPDSNVPPGDYLLPECVGKGHKNCANCLPYALKWREKIAVIIGNLPREQQADLFAYI